MDLAKKRVNAIILCAGSGTRAGLGYNKIFYMFGKKTVLEMVLDTYSDCSFCEITLVISPDDEPQINQIVGDKYDVKICHGGKTRAQSVQNGLNFVSECDIVVIHDGARPYVLPTTIENCVQSAISYGSGICAVKATDTLKQVSNDTIIANIDRQNVYHVQTPQAFDYNQIRDAYNSYFSQKNNANRSRNENPCEPTDDSQIYLWAGYSPRIVEGCYDNIKITTPSDLYGIRGDGILVGNGFDVHQLVEGRRLILGGVEIEHSKGLLGHSDADVLVHAIMDALLSAAGFGDIGVLFPDSDPKFKDISSILLLTEVNKRITKAGFIVQSISAVILAQKPKLASHIKDMRANIANTLNIDHSAINISVTTTETLGLIGQEKAIAASAICLLSNLQISAKN